MGRPCLRFLHCVSIDGSQWSISPSNPHDLSSRDMACVQVAQRAVGLVLSRPTHAFSPQTVRMAARTLSTAVPKTYFSKEQSKSVYEYGAHRSNAEELIDQLPIVEVDGPVALCDGGELSLRGEH